MHMLMLPGCRFGSLEGVLAAQDALKAYGAAHKLLGEGQAGAEVRRHTAANNLAVLKMRPQQQLLPTQQLQECYSHALDALRQHQQQLQPQVQPCSDTPAPQQERMSHPPQQPQQQQQQQQQRLSLLHPARRLHMQQCEPYLSALQHCLCALGIHQQVAHYTSPNGLWCDLLVQLPSSIPAAAAGDSRVSHPHQNDHHQQQLQQPVQDGSSRPAAADPSGGGMMGGLQSESVSAGGSGLGWLACQILGPADLSSGERPGPNRAVCLQHKGFLHLLVYVYMYVFSDRSCCCQLSNIQGGLTTVCNYGLPSWV